MADNSKEQLKRRVGLERRLKQRQASRPQISDSDLLSPEDSSEAETAKLKKKPKIQEKDITGLKYFDKLAPMLERLHHDGCQYDERAMLATVIESDRLYVADQAALTAQDLRHSEHVGRNGDWLCWEAGQPRDISAVARQRRCQSAAGCVCRRNLFIHGKAIAIGRL